MIAQSPVHPISELPIVVTGATGYVGGRLVPALLDAGYRVRCIAREPRKLEERSWRRRPGVTVERSDLSDPIALTDQLRGCSAAYYLVHSMQVSGKEYAERDRMLAEVFAKAAAAAGVERIIYLGGLGELGQGLSEHLSSRRQVEQVLASTGVAVTSFRAAMIIGSGSASFEILRYLVERLPVMVTPSWVKTESQPVAIADVLHWMVRCLSVPETAGKTLEIGGADVLPYRQLMQIMADELGLRKRVIIPLPVLTPRLSSGWISLVTPVSYRIARPLADGLRNRVVVTNDLVQRLMPHAAMGTREAIHKALDRVRTNTVDTRWSVAGPVSGDPDWAGGTVFADERSIIIAAEPERVFQAVCRIGGGHGWYAGDLLWRIRGWMDTLVGGPGLRRGRRDPDRVEFGETLDFWRVVGLERGRTLSLLAEMKLPGVALLNFSMKPAASPGSTSLTMTARFRPKGILGILYWYSVLPLHNIVFGGMLRGIKREAERMDPMLADRPVSSKPLASGYGRARLWLGISAVGTMVVLATLALTIGLPAQASALFAQSLGSQVLLLVAFLATYAAIQFPFDLLGGYILPRRFGRHHLPPLKFAGGLLRGVAAHTSLLAVIGTGLLLAGRAQGVPGVIGVCALLSLALLAIRVPLARILSPLQRSSIDTIAGQSEPSQLPNDLLASNDEGFTGGIVGVLRPRRALMPERWLQELGQAGVTVVMRRRELAVKTGSWARGRLLALGFTLLGVVLAAFVVGPARIGTGEGIITFSLVFTLWSFFGLLTLPTPSRAGVAEVDAGLRASGIDPALIDETIRKLDTLQDAEPERSVGVEAIFHPVPSVRSRIEGPMNRNPLGFLDAARTSVLLSAAGLGLLGRAVHCNCGRPALWIFLPSD
ncbi:MAG: DUF2867 domain-containing protein [Planctomycetota bacterium]|nr:DUF2867 domain-containing protein [Planctomycetota bacterium]